MNRKTLQNNIPGNFASGYLKAFSIAPPFIRSAPPKDLKFSVTIPAFNEAGLIRTLESFYHCQTNQFSVEILIVINWPENAHVDIIAYNRKIADLTQKWILYHPHPSIHFHLIELENMPVKHAGVGLARKTGMDEAVSRFGSIHKPDGILVSFDADAHCEPGFFLFLESHFKSHLKSNGCTVYFEHPLEGSEYDKKVYDAILQYELHLRYYYQGLRLTGQPNTFHTVGSCFAVKSLAYCKQGGMNKRQAGEDFYFLQKLFDLGNFSECNTTRIIPSPRPSDRVPFGTGPSVDELLQNERELHSYHPELFRILKRFIQLFPTFSMKNEIKILEEDVQTISKELYYFLQTQSFIEKLREIKANTSSPESFHKRLLRWFNMFKMLKFLNFAKKKWPDIPVNLAASDLLVDLTIQHSTRNMMDLLQIYRKLEQERT